MKILQLFFTSPNGGTICMQLNPLLSVHEVKRRVCERIGVHPSHHTLLANSGRLKLKETSKLVDLGIESDCNIRIKLSGGLLGGADRPEDTEEKTFKRQHSEETKASTSFKHPKLPSSDPIQTEAANTLPSTEGDEKASSSSASCSSDTSRNLSTRSPVNEKTFKQQHSEETKTQTSLKHPKLPSSDPIASQQEAEATNTLPSTEGGEKASSSSSASCSSDTSRNLGTRSPVNESSLRDKELRYLASNLGTEWERLATLLDFKQSQIQKFKQDRPNDIEGAIFDMLMLWRDAHITETNHRMVLCQALKDVKRVDLADQIQALTGVVHASDTQLLCRDDLRSTYDILCKLDVYPWEDSESIEIDEIFTNLAIVLDMPKPLQAQRIPLKSYEEIFTHRKNPKRVYIQGEAGTGKSTLALKLAHDWASGEGPLKKFKFLFLLRMRDLERGTNLEDAIREHLLSGDCQITSTVLSDWIKSHQEDCCIIFDGYDEANFSVKEKTPKDGNIIDILSNKLLRNCQVIVTSRPTKLAEFGESRKSYTLFEVTGFSQEDVDKYIYKYFGTDERQLADKLLEFIETNSMKIGVVSTPLVTQLLCLYWKWCKGNKMPTSMSKLQNALFHFMKEHHLHKGGKEVDIDTIVSELGKIALDALWPPKSQLVFDRQQVVKASSETTVADACVIGLLKSQNAAFGKRKFSSPLPFAPKKPTVEFYHKTGQETCAGNYLAQLAENQPNEFEAKLGMIDTVQKALDIKLVLLAACGISDRCAESIIKCLIKIYRQSIECEMSEYIKGQLDVETSRHVQLLIELCLQCNFESKDESNFSDILLPLFPNGNAVFTGISAQTAGAFHYMVSNLQDRKSIKVLCVNGVPRAGQSKWGEDDDFDTLCDNVWKTCHDAAGKLSESQLQEQLQGYNVGEDLSKTQLFQVFESWEPETATSVKILSDALRYTELTMINFRNLKMGDESQKLFDVIGRGRLATLERMNLANTGLQDKQIHELARVIWKLQNLRELAINNNKADQSLVDLAEGLTRINLHILHCTGLSASASAIRDFAERLPKMRANLTTLWLDENKIDQDGAEVLCKFFQGNDVLKRLSLCGHKYTRAFMKSCQKMEELGLTWIAEPATSVVDLAARELLHYDDLQHLWLWCDEELEEGEEQHNVTQKASDEFLATLKGMEQLETLSLGHMRFTNNSLQELLAICRDRENLTLEYHRKYWPADIDPKDKFLTLLSLEK